MSDSLAEALERRERLVLKVEEALEHYPSPTIREVIDSILCSECLPELLAIIKPALAERDD